MSSFWESSTITLMKIINYQNKIQSTLSFTSAKKETKDNQENDEKDIFNMLH